MKKSPKISIVGLGNLGWNLGLRLHDRGIEVKQIVARTSTPNEKYCEKIGAELVPRIEQLNNKADLLFICTPDDQLNNIASKVDVKAALVHCSGSTVLFDQRQETGVFYPFQTFTKFFPVNWKDVPIFVESNHAPTRKTLVQLATKLTGNAHEITSSQRRSIHIAGVFSANFVNHILYLAKRVLDKDNIDFQVLEPLLEETLRKAAVQGPAGSQTGPAKRGDDKMIARHLEVLNNDPDLAEVYALLSESIKREYKS